MCNIDGEDLVKKEKKQKNYAGSKTLPASIKEKEAHWPKVPWVSPTKVTILDRGGCKVETINKNEALYKVRNAIYKEPCKVEAINKNEAIYKVRHTIYKVKNTIVDLQGQKHDLYHVRPFCWARVCPKSCDLTQI